MRYRFTRFWARLLVVVGFLAMGTGIVSAGVALFTEEWRQGVTGPQAALERAAVVGFLLLSGFLAGSPFIVFGELLTILLDQRRLLAQILRRLKARDADRGRASSAERRAGPP